MKTENLKLKIETENYFLTVELSEEKTNTFKNYIQGASDEKFILNLWASQICNLTYPEKTLKVLNVKVL